MSGKVIENLSLDLAIKVAKICQTLHDEGHKEIVADRLLNSCVSVGVYMHDMNMQKIPTMQSNT